MSKDEIVEVLKCNYYTDVLEAIKEYTKSELNDTYADTIDLSKGDKAYSKCMLQILWAIEGY